MFSDFVEGSCNILKKPIKNIKQWGNLLKLPGISFCRNSASFILTWHENHFDKIIEWILIQGVILIEWLLIQGVIISNRGWISPFSKWTHHPWSSRILNRWRPDCLAPSDSRCKLKSKWRQKINSLRWPKLVLGCCFFFSKKMKGFFQQNEIPSYHKVIRRDPK